LIALNRPDRAQRVTVFAFTRNMAATSAGVSNFSPSAWSFDIATPSLLTVRDFRIDRGESIRELIGRSVGGFRENVALRRKTPTRRRHADRELMRAPMGELTGCRVDSA
jgi:hypothetical protein